MIHNVPGAFPGGVPGAFPGAVPGGTVPDGSTNPGGIGATSPRGEMQTSVLGGKWELRGADGQIYGPVEKTELDEWASEGRVSANCYLRQEGGEWFPAEQLFPLISGAKPVVNPSSQTIYVNETNSPASGNPFATPTAPTQFHPQHLGRQLQPHNGGAILTLGILGFMCCLVFGIVAWVMGSRDLKAINRGEMDPSGKGLVMAGYILGIVSVVTQLGLIALSCVADGL